MTPAEWTEIAAIGQAIAAISAVAGLFFVGFQIRAAHRSSDLQTLQEFFRTATEREHALLESKGREADQIKAFIEFINFLETYAAAYNKRLLPSVSREQISDKLTESLASIESNSLWSNRLNEAVTGPSALKELMAFRTRHRAEIDRVVRPGAA